MGKRNRHSAKTGDSALYKAAAAAEDDAKKKRRKDDSDDDAMYNEVDRYHNKREEEEYLRFDEDAGGSDAEDDGVTRGREGVFDLGVGGSSDDDDNDGSDDDSDDDSSSSGEDESEEDDASVSSDSDEDDEDGKTNVLDWGSKKSAYYHGDTADLEIGQDEEDAELEEEAGREVVKARLETMDERDFLLGEDDGEESDEESEEDECGGKKTTSSSSGVETLSALSDGRRRAKLTKLSKSERLRLIRSSHPELLPLLQHFRDGAISNLAEETEVLCDALLADPKGAEVSPLLFIDMHLVGLAIACLIYFPVTRTHDRLRKTLMVIDFSAEKWCHTNRYRWM